MRKIVIGMHAGQAGTDAWEFYEVPDDATDDELSDFAWDCAKDHASMYGIYPASEYEEEETDGDDDSDSYSDNIDGWWEEYDPKLHDGHKVGNEIHWNEY